MRVTAVAATQRPERQQVMVTAQLVERRGLLTPALVGGASRGSVPRELSVSQERPLAVALVAARLIGEHPVSFLGVAHVEAPGSEVHSGQLQATPSQTSPEARLTKVQCR